MLTIFSREGGAKAHCSSADRCSVGCWYIRLASCFLGLPKKRTARTNETHHLQRPDVRQPRATQVPPSPSLPREGGGRRICRRSGSSLPPRGDGRRGMADGAPDGQRE